MTQADRRPAEVRLLPAVRAEDPDARMLVVGRGLEALSDPPAPA